jgi:predicted nucleic acid-binding protein
MTRSYALQNAASSAAVVVDASVGVKWPIKEENSVHALALLGSGRRLIVPDRFFSEVANVLWKRTRRADPNQRITAEQARGGLWRILNLPLEVVPSVALASSSLEIALEIGHATYDCDYLALAVLEGVKFVTADMKLYRKLSALPKYGSLIEWIDPNGSL